MNFSSNPNGFVLLESLVALAMVSILAVNVLMLIQGVNSTFGEIDSGDLTPVILELERNPDSPVSTQGELRRESLRNLPSGATWRVYRYDSPSGGPTRVPVYIPPEE
jgi:prepilin-type N-terminal cleavage/methylation domain-containing protein